jgi:LPXTG-motif cell wall-anchored protein
MQASAPVVPGDGQASAPVVPGDGQAAPGAASDKTASLAQSGSDLAPWLLSGLIALLAGGAWLAVARRRTSVDE